MNAKVCAAASRSGHRACLELLHDAHVPWDCEATYNAVRRGHLDCLHNLHTNGCPWDETVSGMAINCGYLLFRHMMTNNSPYNELIVSIAAEAGKMVHLKDLVEMYGVYMN